MQQLVALSARFRPNVLARKAMHSPSARRVLVGAMVALPTVATSALAQSTTGEITSADFTQLATKVLTYLGYAIAAGLTVLVAVIAAQAGWRFFGKFIKA